MVKVVSVAIIKIYVGISTIKANAKVKKSLQHSFRSLDTLARAHGLFRWADPSGNYELQK